MTMIVMKDRWPTGDPCWWFGDSPKCNRYKKFGMKLWASSMKIFVCSREQSPKKIFD